MFAFYEEGLILLVSQGFVKVFDTHFVMISILGNDQDAIYATIEFVQKREPSNLHMYLS